MSSYLLKHFVFVILFFVILYGFYVLTQDDLLYSFSKISATFLSILTTFILVGSIFLSRDSTASTNILMGGIVFKFLMAIAFFVVYILVFKFLNVPIVLMFMLQYFLFTGWLLYLLLKYFNSKDKNAKSAQ